MKDNELNNQNIFKYEGNEYIFPSIDLLDTYTNDIDKKTKNEEAIQKDIEIIVKTLKDFNVDVEAIEFHIGSQFTRIIFKVLSKTKNEKILDIEGNLSLALEKRLAFVLPNYDDSRFAIDVENEIKSTVCIKKAIEDLKNVKDESIKFSVGYDCNFKPIISSFDKTSHILVGGVTSSGKTEFLCSLLTQFAYLYTPEELRIALFDSKAIFYSDFKGLPHLIDNKPIEDPSKMVDVLKMLKEEMKRRFMLFVQNGSSNYMDYNKKVNQNDKLSTIVVMIDDYNDFISSVRKKETNDIINELVLKSRAAGIYLVLSMQKMDNNIIDSKLKSNIPTRIAFRFNDRLDSLRILDNDRAVKLLGHGDNLLTMYGEINRLQTPYVSSKEIFDVLKSIKK